MDSTECPLCWVEAHAGNPANPFPSRLWKGKEIYWLEEGKMFGKPIYKVMRGHWAKPVMQTTDRDRAERRIDAENADTYLRSRLGDRKYLIGIAERVGLTEEELEGFSNVSVMGEIIGSDDFKNIARELAENIQSPNPDGTCATIREVLESECRKAKRLIESTEEYQRDGVKVTWPFCDVLNWHFTKCSTDGNPGREEDLEEVTIIHRLEDTPGNPDGNPGMREVERELAERGIIF